MGKSGLSRAVVKTNHPKHLLMIIYTLDHLGGERSIREMHEVGSMMWKTFPMMNQMNNIVGKRPNIFISDNRGKIKGCMGNGWTPKLFRLADGWVDIIREMGLTQLRVTHPAGIERTEEICGSPLPWAGMRITHGKRRNRERRDSRNGKK